KVTVPLPAVNVPPLTVQLPATVKAPLGALRVPPDRVTLPALTAPLEPIKAPLLTVSGPVLTLPEEALKVPPLMVSEGVMPLPAVKATVPPFRPNRPPRLVKLPLTLKVLVGATRMPLAERLTSVVATGPLPPVNRPLVTARPPLKSWAPVLAS